MKTIELTRTIRRELPNGWLIWIGPGGFNLRPKQRLPEFSMIWKGVIGRAQFLAVKGRR